MKKEKQIRSYKRRTKTGKIVTVKAHMAKYDAADKTKEVSKKEGAGKELKAKKNKMPDLSTHEGQMSYIRSRVKELPEESRKRLNVFLRRASTGAISTTSLWRKYQGEKYPKNKRQRSMPVPWDKKAWGDMAHSD